MKTTAERDSGSGLQEEVAQLAARTGLPVPEVDITHRPTGARVTLKGREDRLVLTADPRVLHASPDGRRQMLLHELGHVALGHLPDRRGRLREQLRLTLAASGFIIVVCTPGLLRGDAARITGLLVLLVVLFGPAGVYMWGQARRRADEYAADRWAAEHGAPLTRQHVEWARANFRGPHVPRGFRLMDSHPTWEQRLAAVATVSGGRGRRL